MSTIDNALENLTKNLVNNGNTRPISFDEFLYEVTIRPQVLLRNIFQVFHDMIEQYMGEGFDEYPNDPESVHYV
ncbi:MAG: hypothetical protein GX640_15020, partial [Fibrobacter sp.]|nr:hypothetical protein [Fibrobacter sp.]